MDILLPPDSLNWILMQNNLSSNCHFPATFIYGNGTDKDTLENVGFRLRDNSSRSAESTVTMRLIGMIIITGIYLLHLVVVDRGVYSQKITKC